MPNDTQAPERANTQLVYEVSESDLPAACPMPGTVLWNSHPRVWLNFGSTGEAQCPYCGALYKLKLGA